MAEARLEWRMFAYDESEVSVGDYTLAVTSDDGPWWSIRAVGGSDDIDGGSCESMHAARLAAEDALFGRLEAYRPLLYNAPPRSLDRPPHATTIREERDAGRDRVAEKRAARMAALQEATDGD